MPTYLYEVFLTAEREPRIIEANSLDRARAEAKVRFSKVRHVRLAREWFNDTPVPDVSLANGMVDYIARHPFGNIGNCSPDPFADINDAALLGESED